MIDSDNDGEVNFQEFQDYFAYIPLADTTSVVKHLVGPAGIDFGTDLAVPTPPAADMPLWRFVTAGACGGLCSRTATALERLKLEAQINGTRGLYSTAKQILRGEGASGFYAGNLVNWCSRCTVCRQCLPGLFVVPSCSARGNA